jgi:undecaprenyl pyrophosphate synthase
MFRRFWRTGLYALYTRRLRQQVLAGPLPRHVGLIMDGNRRWARQAGLASPGLGHRAGAEHVERVLSWCEAVGIKEVTLFICSTERADRALARRGPRWPPRAARRSRAPLRDLARAAPRPPPVP